ncbi:hypothetical protein [Dactylosporangium sp. NPDC005555]|uniref:hypothetical protein n=1 Tax=Dactylosporangium sp. NPDC005555 TaxID=3154889 RepID=UPI0033B9898E
MSVRRLVLPAAVMLAISLIPGVAAAYTTVHTGSGRPALALASNRLYAAWTGSTSGTSGKQLIVAWSGDGGRTFTKDNTVVERIPEGEGPALDADGSFGYAVGVYLAWPAANNGNTLTVGYTIGSGLKCRTAITGVRTDRSPAMTHDSTFGTRWIAWTGTDNRINVARLDSTGCTGAPGGMVLRDRVTLAETTTGGPALVFDDSGAGNGLILGWTGAGGVINLATVTPGSSVLTNRSTVTQPGQLSTGALALTSHPSDLYIWFRATDGTVHRGYSQGCRPTCFYMFAWELPAASPVGAGTDGFHDTIGYFDPNGKLNVATY